MKKLLPIILLFIIFSCDNEPQIEDVFSIEKIDIEAGSEIKDMLLVNDNIIYLTGGKKSEEGFIFRSQNGGKSWVNVLHTDNLSVNSIYFREKCKYWAAGDSIVIWRSEDGLNWQKNIKAPCYWNNCRNPYHDIQVWKESKVFAVGGEFFQRGITSFSNTGLSYWIQLYWGNQLNDFIIDAGKTIIAGYGIVLQTDTISFEDFDDMDIYGENFIKLSKNPEGDLFLLSQKGKIFEYINEKWEKTDNLKGNYRDFCFSGNTGLALGDNGVLALSEDNGKTWEKYNFINNKNLSCIESTNDGFLIGCRDGSLYRIEF